MDLGVGVVLFAAAFHQGAIRTLWLVHTGIYTFSNVKNAKISTKQS